MFPHLPFVVATALHCHLPFEVATGFGGVRSRCRGCRGRVYVLALLVVARLHATHTRTCSLAPPFDRVSMPDAMRHPPLVRAIAGRVGADHALAAAHARSRRQPSGRAPRAAVTATNLRGAIGPSVAAAPATTMAPTRTSPGHPARRLLPPRVQVHAVVARGGRRQQPAVGIPNAAVSAPHLAIALREAARVPLQCRITASAVLSSLITPEVARCVCAGGVRTTHETASMRKSERAARRAGARLGATLHAERARASAARRRGATRNVQRFADVRSGVCVDGVNCATARETRLGI